MHYSNYKCINTFYLFNHLNFSQFYINELLLGDLIPSVFYLYPKGELILSCLSSSDINLHNLDIF